MQNKSLFDEIFRDFISGDFPKDKIISLKNNLIFDWNINFIESLNDPSDYF